MATKITPEAVKERIAALESAGELSLKEQRYLEIMHWAIEQAMENAALKSVIAENWRLRDVLRQLLNKRPGGVYFNKWEPIILEVLNAPCRHAEPAPVVPDGMLKIGYMFITDEGGTVFSISDVPVPGMTLAGPVYAPAVKAGE